MMLSLGGRAKNLCQVMSPELGDNTAEAADSGPDIPAIFRQCFTNWLFRNLGAFQESRRQPLLPIREGLPVTRAKSEDSSAATKSWTLAAFT